MGATESKSASSQQSSEPQQMTEQSPAKHTSVLIWNPQDPRSPNERIIRTPIRALNSTDMMDPRSPGLQRTPIKYTLQDPAVASYQVADIRTENFLRTQLGYYSPTVLNPHRLQPPRTVENVMSAGEEDAKALMDLDEADETHSVQVENNVNACNVVADEQVLESKVEEDDDFDTDAIEHSLYSRRSSIIDGGATTGDEYYTALENSPRRSSHFAASTASSPAFVARPRSATVQVVSPVVVRSSALGLRKKAILGSLKTAPHKLYDSSPQVALRQPLLAMRGGPSNGSSPNSFYSARSTSPSCSSAGSCLSEREEDAGSVPLLYNNLSLKSTNTTSPRLQPRMKTGILKSSSGAVRIR